MEKQFEIPNFFNKKQKENIKKNSNKKIKKVLEVIMLILMLLAGSSANLKTALAIIPLFGLSVISYNYFGGLEND